MKTIFTLLIALCAIPSFAQTTNEGNILIDKTQKDDTYLAGETVKVDAAIQGDLVIAGGNLTLNESIEGDLTAAGGELFLNGYVSDDVRMAVGTTTIDSEIGDDLLVFGGELILTENAIVHGNLNCFAGDVKINGTINGKLKVKGANVFLNGTVKETSKIVAEDFILGPNAQFYKKVEYWNGDGELDFGNTLVDTEAQFNEGFAEEKSQLSLKTFGTASFFLWIFYVLSAFLVILVLHALFKNTFSAAVEGLEGNWLKSFGFGLIYLFGIPLFIILTLLLIIGIPLGLFVSTIFIFSLLFGHLVASLLVVYYYRHKKEKNWGFWNITFLALLVAIILRLLTIIPFMGILVSIVILSISYGALTLKVIQSKKLSKS